MACQRETGEEAEWTMGCLKQRGRNLSEAEIRRLRDLVFLLLIRVMGLSIRDAQEVFGMGSAVKRHAIYKRFRQCPLGQRDVVRQMRSLLSGGNIHAG